MPAQFIVMPPLTMPDQAQAEKEKEKKKDKEKEKEDKKTAAPTGGGTGGQEPIYPPYIPIPVGTLAIYGQKPVRVGDFATVKDLVDDIYGWKDLPGRSNTVFATVANMDDLTHPEIHDRIATLPDALTVIVLGGKIRA